MGILDRILGQDEAQLMKRAHAHWRSDPDVAARIERVLSLDPAAVGISAGSEDERGLPGNPEFVKSGWSDHMLLRYFLAMDEAKDRRVLDTCCGLGWGAHLVAGVARELVGVDLDAGAIAFCDKTWGDPNARYVEGSVLELPFDDGAFDVVLCMEAIEHFSVEDGLRYMRELARVCKPGGVVLGSSTFLDDREAADALCAQNEFHLHIYTQREMRALLKQTFSRPKRLTLHYFAATKPR